MLDDQPIGSGIGCFLFEYLADAHERRVFHEPHAALAERRVSHSNTSSIATNLHLRLRVPGGDLLPT